MNVLIIIKWMTNYSGHESSAPSIINTMINIPLKLGTINGQPFIGDASTNQSISLILLAISLVCIPLMLCFKPFILDKHHKKEESIVGEELGEIGNRENHHNDSSQHNKELIA
jgi:V-type H+-transporting ATPase subunit a